MASLKTVLSASPALSTLVASAPNLPTRQISSIILDFCTEAIYPNDDPYGEPMGGGYCAGLIANLGTCSWSSFPTSLTGPLVNNLTYVFIPGTYECNLYKGYNCTGPPYVAQDGNNDSSNSEFGPTTYNKAVNSFLCISD